MHAAATVASWLAERPVTSLLTGAGISTDSGIPDFRGPRGLWTTTPGAERLSTQRDYLADPALRREAWRRRADHPVWTARPGPGHLALAAMERAGRLDTLVTQNIDGLHQAAGSSPKAVVEVHGTLWEAECQACGDRTPMSGTLDRVRAGEADPPCLACGGILKSATISFGQPLDPAVLERAGRAAARAELFLVVGSSLVVHPVAGLCDLARDAGARLVIVNADPTPYDACADAVLRDPIGVVLPELVRPLLQGAHL